MIKELIHPILLQPIGELNVSREFKAMAEANEFMTLNDILKESLHELPFKKLSGYLILKEMLLVLEENGLSELTDD